MRLFICEKPSQARDIARVLGASKRGDGCLIGAGVTVTWCFGHLLETAEPEAYGEEYKRWALETLPILPHTWKMKVKKSAAGQFKNIKTLLRSATEVVIATDADREGETIGREVLDACNYKGKIFRLWLSALDDASIKKALSAIMPGEKTFNLYQAGIARSRADWLVGMNLTRAFTLMGKQAGFDGVLSVGRVQTPTLRIVVERDKSISQFTPVPYFDVLAVFKDPVSNSSFTGRWMPVEGVSDEEGRCVDKSAAMGVIGAIRGGAGSVKAYNSERVKEAAPLLYDLGTLQQECSSKFGMSAQQVLDTAQALYEVHKATSYPRTDCGYLPTSMQSEIQSVLSALSGSDSSFSSLVAKADTTIKSRAWNDAKITAHHGIIPTTGKVDISKFNQAEMNVYDLIRRRYLAQFFVRHEFDKAEAVLSVGVHDFRATGKVVRVQGWKELFSSSGAENENSESAEQESALPVLAKDIEYPIIDTQCIDKMTRPPAHFTDGTLLAAMKNAARYVEDPNLKKMLKETAGLGTEATRAAIIETLKQRGYLVQKKRALISTPTAQALVAALPTSVKDPGMTALWEQALEDIAAGDRDLDDFMQRQASWVSQLVDRLKQSKVTLDIPGIEKKQCPDCSQPMRKIKSKIKSKKDFWGCTGYPECKKTVAA